MKDERQTARHALLAAFAELALSHRYQDVGVGLITGKARVARSTFYYHFKAKDDLLLQNLKPMMSALAGLAVATEVTKDVEYWVSHIWEHRTKAKRMFQGSVGRKISAALALELRSLLGTRQRDLPDEGSAALIADQIAGSTMGLLNGWIEGRAAATPLQIAAMLWSGTRALAGADAVGEEPRRADRQAINPT